MAGESAREEARRARERAQRLERRAALFELGAAGEAATAAVLAGLPRGWTAIHDVRWPGRRLANVDHVVVGPGGVFVIDSKNWSGRISVDGGHLRQNGRSREKAVASAADAGLAVAALVGPYASSVSPVLCFVGEAELAGWCRDVMVCSTSNLRQMLLTRPTTLSTDESADACLRLNAHLRAATNDVGQRRPSTAAAVPAVTRRASSARRGSMRAPAPSLSRRTRRDPSARRFVVGVVALLAFVTWGPALATAVGPALAELMTRNVGQPPCADVKTSDEPQAVTPKLRDASRRAKRADAAPATC